MTRPVHNLVAYYEDNTIIHEPWSTRKHPATSEALAEQCERYNRDLAGRSNVLMRYPLMERAVLTKFVQLHGPSWGFSRVIVARWLRSTIPTEDQEREIKRIADRPGVAYVNAEQLDNGDVLVSVNGLRQTTSIKRHPTVKELIYGDD
jgi:hypothetical protein